ncbi:TPA: hypothetical protein DCE37_17745 [Candidatus Latescibacteria bacterium]|nr:hypothetical protein [Candidatus Latescibacterota bacterium]
MITYVTLIILPYIVVPVYVLLILQRAWFWMKLYNPALKLIPGPGSTFRVWSRQYRPTIDLFPQNEMSLGRRLWHDFKGLILFSGLFRRDKPLWLGSWLFHVSLTILFIVHLKWILPLTIWLDDETLRQVGIYAGWALMASAIYLLIRRLLVARVRQVTSLTDYVSEILLALTVATGLWVVTERPDASEVSRYLSGLVSFSPEMPTFHRSLVLHLLSMQLLLLVMPFSHLLHSGGILVSRRFLASPNTFSGDVE